MQKAYSFDSATMQKIGKGFLYSLASTVLLGVLNTLMAMSGQVHFNDPLVAMGYAYICQNLFNIGKEWASGIIPIDGSQY